jgi:salicylate 5-hydroxylase small subunit
VTAQEMQRERLIELYAAYASCVDAGKYDEWPDFFTEDAWYRIVSRENLDRNLPLSTLSLHGRPMMRDRNYGIESTIFHAPYYQRHILSPTRILSQGDGALEAETNYLVIRTKRDVPAEIFNTGVYLDRVVETPAGLRFARRFCVFDNDLIPNSLIYPI